MDRLSVVILWRFGIRTWFLSRRKRHRLAFLHNKQGEWYWQRALCPYKGGVWLGPSVYSRTMQSESLLEKLISWIDASSTQLLKSGTVSQTMLLEQFLIWVSSILKAVCIGFFWTMVNSYTWVSHLPHWLQEFHWVAVNHLFGLLDPWCFSWLLFT